MPGFTSSTFSSTCLREPLVDRPLPPARVVPAFGMAIELIICLVRRVVGMFAILMRNLSCLVAIDQFINGRELESFV